MKHKKSLREHWKNFLSSNACVYVIIGCAFYGLIVGFPSLMYACWFHGSPWWMIVNWLFPGVIVIVLMLTARPKQKPMKPERYTTAMANAEEVTAQVKAWMEAERFNEMHTEQEGEVTVFWGHRYRRSSYTLVEYVAVLSYAGAYSEEVEMAVLEGIFQKVLEHTKRGPRVNLQIISIHCIKNRQSALTKVLYRPAAGSMDLMVHCGYVEQEHSFRIQAIDTMLINNTGVLRKMRKRVLAMFEGKLTPVEEKQKEPK